MLAGRTHGFLPETAGFRLGSQVAGRRRDQPHVHSPGALLADPFEFPFLQRLAARYRGRVAFLGVDAQDNRGDAEAFLKQRPLPYPSFYDLNAAVARTFKGGLAWPTTAFYDARGTLERTHPGAYATQAKLDEDIRRYALVTS